MAAIYFQLDDELVCVTSLYTQGGLSEPGCVFLGAGVYDPRDSHRGHDWTGKGYSGNIPTEALLRWAIEQGYVKPDYTDNYDHATGRMKQR